MNGNHMVTLDYYSSNRVPLDDRVYCDECERMFHEDSGRLTNMPFGRLCKRCIHRCVVCEDAPVEREGAFCELCALDAMGVEI